MRTCTDGVRPYKGRPIHQSADELITYLSSGVFMPQAALRPDQIATERELGQAAGKALGQSYEKPGSGKHQDLSTPIKRYPPSRASSPAILSRKRGCMEECR